MSAQLLEVITVKDELHLICQQNGGIISPRAVVEFARDPNTLLHSKFEWDDSAAAEQYRLWQARKIIGLELTIIPAPAGSKKSVETREYVSLHEDRTPEGGYRPIEAVLKDQVLRERLLDEAKREMMAFQLKYSQLTELSKVFKAMKKVLTS